MKTQVDYTRFRKKKNEIEVCPKCNRKGKVVGRFYNPKVDNYIHIMENDVRDVAGLGLNFRKVLDECNVPNPEKERFYNQAKKFIVSAELQNSRDRPIGTDTRNDILSDFYSGWTPEVAASNVIDRRMGRVVRSIERNRQHLLRMRRILDSLKPSNTLG